ncbi:hypothetical protein ASG93_29290 [Paenibacillus sp. Soil787]|nr:hypothetical protein ASG93_29290 [Paenibacillus sp. Soil787]
MDIAEADFFAAALDTLSAAVPGLTGLGRGAKAVNQVVEGLNKLEKSEKIAAIQGGKLVMAYSDLRKVSKGTGLEAHHLIEKRFIYQINKGLEAAGKNKIVENDILSIAIDKDTHQKITNLFRQKIGYAYDNKTIRTDNAELQDIWDAVVDVYTEVNMPE